MSVCVLPRIIIEKSEESSSSQIKETDKSPTRSGSLNLL